MMFLKLPLACILLFLPSALSCGGFFCQLAAPVIQTGESIVFGVDGNKVTMHVQILYEGPAEGFSWVLPVPYQPNVAVGSDRIFTAMFTRTLPSFQLSIGPTDFDTCGPEQACGLSESFAGEIESDGQRPMADADAIVLEEGSVGPYDFVVLEAADGDPSSVFRWLEENDYDQPDETEPLINFYAAADHVFVALKLQKKAEVGEIQPLILEYEMPEAEDMSRAAIACVPIQLTRIAATPQMPITVYVLGDARAVPLNYMEMQLDDTQVDWVGCLNGGARCYDADYRDRFGRAANEIANHTFVTEYAGTARVMDGLITIPITKEDIESVRSQQEFFDTISFLLPQIPLVDSILQDYTGETFNATALAEELHEKVLQPAIDDQEYVDGFDYLTRLYARLSPEMMNKDPFFAFKPELPKVSNIHSARGDPICVDGRPQALRITVDSTNDTIITPAGFGGCGGWVPFDPVVPVNETVEISPALQVASYGFAGDDGVVVVRLESGTFDMTEVEEAVRFGDSLVMSQEIPGLSNKTLSPSASAVPTTVPTVASATEDAEPTLLPSSTTEGSANETEPTMAPSMVEPSIAPSMESPDNNATLQPTSPLTNEETETAVPSAMGENITASSTSSPGTPATVVPTNLTQAPSSLPPSTSPPALGIKWGLGAVTTLLLGLHCLLM